MILDHDLVKFIPQRTAGSIFINQSKQITMLTNCGTEKHTIISIYADKAVNKIHQSIMIKTLKKLKIEETFLI